MAVAVGTTLNDTDSLPEEEEEEEDSGEDLSDVEQKEAKRNLDRIKKEVKDQVKKQVQKVAKKVASKVAVRAVSLACGATGIGLIVTYIIWTGQAIIANLLGHDKIIPKLDWWELILWGILTIIILALLLVAVILMLGAFIFSNPVTAAGVIGAIVWNIIAG